MPIPRVVAICGRRSNLLISSGTELPLPELFNSDQSSPQEWEIVREPAHMLQLLRQLMPLFQSTGMVNTYMSLWTDKKIVQLSMPNFPSTHSTMPTSMLQPPSSNTISSSVLHTPSTRLMMPTIYQVSSMEDIRVTHMLEETHGNYCLQPLVNCSTI